MCITKARGTHGHFVTTADGMMTLEEVMKFQGYMPEQLNWQASSVARGHWGAAMGDGMSLNVMGPVLKEALTSAGLV